MAANHTALKIPKPTHPSHWAGVEETQTCGDFGVRPGARHTVGPS